MTMKLTALLVPLDGSEASAAALPYAEAIAAGSGAEMRLLAIVEREPRGLTDRSERVAGAIEHEQRQHLEGHLLMVATGLGERGITASESVVTGDPLEEILVAGDDPAVGIIAMTTHGVGGVGRWMIGRVADKVMRLSGKPVLLVRPSYAGGPRRAASVQHMMAPLDGSELAEAALEPAVALAGVLGAALTLIRVEPWRTEGMAPLGSMPEYVAMEDEAAAAARQYLDGVVRRLPEGVTVNSVVLRGRPASTLVDFAHHERMDLIVMTTHGRGGIARLVLGSTADRVVRAGVPTLLIRPAVPRASG